MAETVQAYAVEFVPPVVFLREEDAVAAAKRIERSIERAAKAALEGGAE